MKARKPPCVDWPRGTKVRFIHPRHYAADYTIGEVLGVGSKYVFVSRKGEWPGAYLPYELEVISVGSVRD